MPKHSDLIFPHLPNAETFSTTLSNLKKSTLSISNRLSSISSDSEFVAQVASAYDLPLVANERCGSWYIPTERKTASGYFKSTDGHTGEWGFSLRRLNLHLLDLIAGCNGAVIVDSTRRGKSMPDALSKTVPIWCCVINRAVFGEGPASDLFTPPQAVAESEHDQILQRIPGFVQQFKRICKPNTEAMRAKLQKPLRPFWITQRSTLPESPPSFSTFHPVVLCTASRWVQGAEVSERGYIQGAADDHEAWAMGLTPAIFWAHENILKSISDEAAPKVIARLMREEKDKDTSARCTLIAPTSNIYIGESNQVDFLSFDVAVVCTPEESQSTVPNKKSCSQIIHVKCQTGKLGSRDLRSQLPLLLDALSAKSLTSKSRIFVCCPTGKDLAVGIVLAILCLYADDEGMINTSTRRSQTKIDKDFIKQRLSWITTNNVELNPSRATLQSVNAVLLASHDPKLTLTTTVSYENPSLCCERTKLSCKTNFL